MIVAFWGVLIAGVLPLACTYLAKFGPGSDGSDPFDNHNPRAWKARQTGLRARARAAEANSWEAFPLFAIGVVVAVLQHVPIATINLIAVIFIVARVAYIACYASDQATLRSMVWAIGFAASIALYLFAAAGTFR